MVIVGFQAPGALLASFVPMFLIAGAFFYMNRADQGIAAVLSTVILLVTYRLLLRAHRDRLHRLLPP